jgi:predicted RNase H-like HicB family nuclease
METAVSRDVMAEFHRYALRLEQSKLDGWWFIFVDALPGLLVFGPNYEDLLGQFKVAAGNLFRARGETVANIEITTVESGEVAMELWMVPAEKAEVSFAPRNVSLYNNCN